jgi:hypothetical protein
MKIDTSFNLQTKLKDDFLRADMNIVNMQINDILILIDSNFVVAKEKAIVDVKIMTKFRNDLDSNFLLKFNDTIIERQKNDIYLRQISVNSPQLVTRNVVTVDYVDAWVRWWMIFIRWLHNVLYKWFSISSHVKYSAHMLNTRFVT